jgi:hypothetical protein
MATDRNLVDDRRYEIHGDVRVKTFARRITEDAFASTGSKLSRNFLNTTKSETSYEQSGQPSRS